MARLDAFQRRDCVAAAEISAKHIRATVERLLASIDAADPNLVPANLRAVNWRTIGWGVALQLALAVLVLKFDAVYRAFEAAGGVVKQFISFSDAGARFVFGNLADARPPSAGGTWSRLFPADYMFQFAFVALPPILFVSAFFTVLYHFGVLQWIVRMMAKAMVHLMRTSGAETLSVSANVFMGQTEAPLIVKPYVPRMTKSELFVLMASGMAHVSGGMMVVYINYGADPVAVLTTCIMACPGSLYLSKLFMPELTTPETAGVVQQHKEKSPFVNGIDAAAAGTGDGLRLALNVAAMLVVFIAFVAFVIIGASNAVASSAIGFAPPRSSLRPPANIAPHWAMCASIMMAAPIVAAIELIRMSLLRTCASSWAMTPSSSDSDSSRRMPSVAATAACDGLRPVANAFGDMSGMM